MPSKLRLQRIADRIREDLSQMIVMNQIHDPRISGVSVTDVKVDRELAYADVFVSSIGGSEEAKGIIQGLESASGYIRHVLAERIDLRVFPRLRFHWDPTPERAERIERLIASLHEEDNKSKQQPEEPGGDD